MKFVHAADIHLDSPLVGLRRFDAGTAREIRLATRRALENLIQLCLEEDIDFLLISGDLFDGAWKDINTGLFMLNALNRLAEKNISVWIVKGNHDAVSEISRTLAWPEHIHIFSHRKPETCFLDDLGVAIHGWSYPRRDIYDNISEQFPDAHPDYFNIGLLHTALTGRSGHAPYAPCSVADLDTKGYDYWALGHVHTRDVIETTSGKIVFPGNLQGRHIREPGARGAYLVTVSSDTNITLEFKPLHTVEWTQVELDVSECRSIDDIVSSAIDALDEIRNNHSAPLVVARLNLVGRSTYILDLFRDPALQKAQIKTLIESGLNEIFVEKIVFNVTPDIDISRILASQGPFQDLFRNIKHRMNPDTDIQDLLDLFTPLHKKLPIDFRRHPDTVKIDDPETIRRFLKDAESIILAQLSETETDR